MSYVKAKVSKTDMKEGMQQAAVDACAEAISQPDCTPIEIASKVREHFDRTYGTSWTCIVGKDFSSSFAYEKNKYISLEVSGQQILLFKST